MKRLHYRGFDGTVTITDGVTTYADTIDNLARDTTLLLTPLPDGVDERVYEPGVRHALNRAQHTIDGGDPQAWAEGDALIADLPNLVASKKQRLTNDAISYRQAIAASLAVAQKRLDDADAPAATRATSFMTPDTSDLLARARTATPDQIDTWLANNVTNLTSARNVLGAIIKLLVARRLV